MTQDFSANEEDNKEHIGLLDVQCNSNRLPNCNKVVNENEQPSKDFTVQQPNNNCHFPKQPEITSDVNETIRTDFSNNSVLKFNSSFPANNSLDIDPMKTLKLNIRRKRLCSNSSALSNNDSAMEDKESSRKMGGRRKGKFTFIKMTAVAATCAFRCRKRRSSFNM